MVAGITSAEVSACFRFPLVADSEVVAFGTAFLLCGFTFAFLLSMAALPCPFLLANMLWICCKFIAKSLTPFVFTSLPAAAAAAASAKGSASSPSISELLLAPTLTVVALALGVFPISKTAFPPPNALPPAPPLSSNKYSANKSKSASPFIKLENISSPSPSAPLVPSPAVEADTNRGKVTLLDDIVMAIVFVLAFCLVIVASFRRKYNPDYLLRMYVLFE
mmetsp:Transcript_7210/g.10769  ORF Transcript_7210/g.10769 Transcript_7210/m.10769 type:complete len:221 (-) Transcript_7210:71-733(-)